MTRKQLSDLWWSVYSDTESREDADRAVADATGASRCAQSTLCPDDIIRPCVRPAKHEGFCFGGVK